MLHSFRSPQRLPQRAGYMIVKAGGYVDRTEPAEENGSAQNAFQTLVSFGGSGIVCPVSRSMNSRSSSGPGRGGGSPG